MLSLLGDMAAYRPLLARDDQEWLDIDEALIARAMPFWSAQDIQRISKNLRDQGIILLASAPFTESRRLTVAFNDGQAARKPVEQHRPLPIINMNNVGKNGGANLIAPNWQPD